MMKSRLLISALAVLGAIACGDSGDPKPTGGDEDAGMDEEESEDGGADVPATRTASGTLVAVTATDISAPIKIPHKIVVLYADNDEPMGPKYETMTSASDGSWEIKDIPTGRATSLHIQGQGSATEGTYDSVLTNIVATTAEDAITRISSASTANVAGILSGFTAMPDKSALTVGVYQVRNRKRVKAIGCTQAWLDDDPSQPPKEGDLRYVGAGGLPTTISTQNKTEASRGAMLFANIAKGKHTIKLSVDGGKTFFGTTEFYIGKAREDATSAYKGILYQLGIELPDDHTPAGCQ